MNRIPLNEAGFNYICNYLKKKRASVSTNSFFLSVWDVLDSNQ